MGCYWEGKSKEAVGTQRLRWNRARREGAEGRRQCWGEWALGRTSRTWLSSNRNRGCSLTDMGVASDLAKDVCLSPRGFSHLLQLLRTQSLSCHLHDFHCKLMASSSMNTTADHRAHSSARVRQHRSQGLLLSHFQQSRASASSYILHPILKTHLDKATSQEARPGLQQIHSGLSKQRRYPGR